MAHFFYALENKRLDKYKQLDSDLSSAKKKADKLQQHNLTLMKDRDESRVDVSTF